MGGGHTKIQGAETETESAYIRETRTLEKEVIEIIIMGEDELSTRTPVPCDELRPCLQNAAARFPEVTRAVEVFAEMMGGKTLDVLNNAVESISTPLIHIHSILEGFLNIDKNSP